MQHHERSHRPGMTPRLDSVIEAGSLESRVDGPHELRGATRSSEDSGACWAGEHRYSKKTQDMYGTVEEVDYDA